VWVRHTVGETAELDRLKDKLHDLVADRHRDRDDVIRRCTDADVPAIHAIINDAAEAYRGVIPVDCWHEPYMTRASLSDELAAGVEFSGTFDDETLVGVMGLQRVRDVTLIRHAYVRASHQGRGIGAALLRALLAQVDGPLLVGTWADATWAIRFYERHGFRLVAVDDKNRLLGTYWTIAPRQRETSVVLVRADSEGARARSI
jgi:GNAT superfamily N-acetyltransferase